MLYGFYSHHWQVQEVPSLRHLPGFRPPIHRSMSQLGTRRSRKFTYGGVAWIQKRGGGVPMTLGWFSCLGNSFCCNIKNFCCETEIWNKNSRKLFDFGISSASLQTLHYLLHPGCFLVLTFSSRCTVCYQKELVLYYLLETQGDLFQ